LATSGEEKQAVWGTLALVGSGEYLPPMERVDRLLLARLPGEARVVCLPTAAGTEGAQRIRYWSELGVRHFTRMGAQAEAVEVIDRQTAHDPSCVARIESANFVYLSGGKPDYLYDTLAGSPAWAAIMRVLEGGGVVAGCSAGAMICGVRSSPWSRHPGFNLLPEAAIMPHYDEMPEALARVLRLGPARQATLVGIDGNTALFVSRDGSSETRDLTVAGAGSVTVWGAAGPVRYSAGDRIAWPVGR
jgi:cyanophycinase